MKLQDFKKKLLRNPQFREEYYKKDLAFEISMMLIEARILKGVTQEKLATMIKTKQSGIARIENGEHLPSLSLLEKIAKAFKTRLIAPKFEFMVERETQLKYNADQTAGIQSSTFVSHRIYSRTKSSESLQNFRGGSYQYAV